MSDTQTSIEARAHQAFSELRDFLTTSYHEPDIEGVEVALSAAAARHLFPGPGVWLFIIGPASAGKTDLAITAITALPNTHVTGEVTANTLLSAYAPKGKTSDEHSLLLRIKNGTLAFTDFSSFTSLSSEVRERLAAQMRHAYDGHIVKETGMGKRVEWSGQLTIIAAATPKLESAWGVMRDLGERFVQLRWRAPDDEGAGRFALRRIGRGAELKSQLLAKTKKFISVNVPATVVPDVAGISSEDESALVALASFVATLRCAVRREQTGARRILEQPVPERSPRLAQVFAQLAYTHAALMGRQSLTDDDLRIARRVATDCVPLYRQRVVLALTADEIKLGDLVRRTGIDKSTVVWTCHDLAALGCVTLDERRNERYVRLSDHFAALKKRALPDPSSSAYTVNWKAIDPPLMPEDQPDSLFTS